VQKLCLRRRADGKKKFVHDFVAAWAEVMDLDRFELAA
jgi:catalase (peroxidase I)